MQELSYTTHRMEFAFLSNSMMRHIKGYNAPYKNIKSPCKIRIRLVWHNEYSIFFCKSKSFFTDLLHIEKDRADTVFYTNISSFI